MDCNLGYDTSWPPVMVHAVHAGKALVLFWITYMAAGAKSKQYLYLFMSVHEAHNAYVQYAQYRSRILQEGREGKDTCHQASTRPQGSRRYVTAWPNPKGAGTDKPAGKAADQVTASQHYRSDYLHDSRNP
jgi:hypothetical protein